MKLNFIQNKQQKETNLTVSNMVTNESKVVTSNTMRPGTISGMTQKLPHDIMTKREDGR